MNWEKLRQRLAARGTRFREGGESARLLPGRPVENVQFSPEWEEQLGFDAAFSRALRSEPAPPGLREEILADLTARCQAQSRGPGWWRTIHALVNWPRRWRPARLALVVGLIVLLTVPLWIPDSMTFQEYRAEVLANAWTAERHLAFQATDLSQLQAWAQAQDAPWPTHFPTALGEISVAGSRVFRVGGHQVTLLCFTRGVHHTHLFVMDQLDLPGQPGDQFPQLSRCQGWDTASWTCNGQTFILTGLKSLTFVKQFRKEGHWTWNG